MKIRSYVDLRLDTQYLDATRPSGPQVVSSVMIFVQQVTQSHVMWVSGPVRTVLNRDPKTQSQSTGPR